MTLRKRINGYAPWIFAFLIPLLAFAVGFGGLQSQVGSNRDDITRVDAKLDRIIEILLEHDAG